MAKLRVVEGRGTPTVDDIARELQELRRARRRDWWIFSVLFAVGTLLPLREMRWLDREVGASTEAVQNLYEVVGELHDQTEALERRTAGLEHGQQSLVKSVSEHAKALEAARDSQAMLVKSVDTLAETLRRRVQKLEEAIAEGVRRIFEKLFLNETPKIDPKSTPTDPLMPVPDNLTVAPSSD